MMESFRSRVSIVDASGQVLFQAPGPQAETLLTQGAAVWARQGGKVAAIRLGEGQQLRDDRAPAERPGSYGVFREHLPSGYYCFTPKRDWGKELARGFE